MILSFVIASFEGLQAAGRRMNATGSSRETALVIVGLVAVAALWAGLYMWDRRRRPIAVKTENAGLFGELCRAHRLSKEDRALLLRAAGSQENTAVVFVDPDVLATFADSHPGEAAQFRRMRDRIFGG